MTFTRAADPAIDVVRAWLWQLKDGQARDGFARQLSDAAPTLQLFDDVEAPALLGAAWGGARGPRPARLDG